MSEKSSAIDISSEGRTLLGTLNYLPQALTPTLHVVLSGDAYQIVRIAVWLVSGPRQSTGSTNELYQRSKR